MKIPYDDIITVFDLRFYQPNLEVMPERGAPYPGTSVREFYAQSFEWNMREDCGYFFWTSFYMSLIGVPNKQHVIDAWKATIVDVLKVKDQKQIPELNEHQGCTHQMHSLHECAGDRAVYSG